MSLERRKEPGEAWETVEATGNGGSQPVLTATRTLTSVELLAMNGWPAGPTYTLIPSAGPGTQTILLWALAKYNFGTTPYITVSGEIAIGPVSIDVNPYYAEWAQFPISGFLDAEQDVCALIRTGMDNGGGYLYVPPWEDEDIVIYSAGDPVTDGDGTVDITGYYTVQPT